jgi:hypothetical protein
MGKKTQIARASLAGASLAAAFVAAGGAATTQASASDPTAVESVAGIVSSYFGQLGVRDDFQQYLKASTGFESFLKYWKFSTREATDTVVTFSKIYHIAPPPGFTVGVDGP